MPTTRRQCAEIGDGARTGIKVVEHVFGFQVCELARHLVELVGLFGIGLVERLGAHLETQPLHLLDDMVFAFVAHRVEVAHRIVELRIDDVAQRGDLRECGRQMVEQRRDPFAVVRTTVTITSPVEAVRTIMLRISPVCSRALWNV